jgi:hypothetical protein
MIDLISDTGIQFYHVPKEDVTRLVDGAKSLQVAESSKTLPNGMEVWELQVAVNSKSSGRLFDVNSISDRLIDRMSGDIDWDHVDESKLKEIDGATLYSKSTSDALETYHGRWIPLPYFRRHSGQEVTYDEGPTSWARLWIGREEVSDGVFEHDMVVAFDTRVVDSEDGYSMLRAVDATPEGQAIFKCASQERHLQDFYSLEWVEAWLRFEMERIRAPHIERQAEHVVLYLALMRDLGLNNILPDVKIFNKEEHIEVSLVIDVGNSRTCGLLAETSGAAGATELTEQDLTKLRRLELRDLSRPNRIEADPFDMHVTFAEETFGNETTAMNYVKGGCFSWPSMVRLGAEASHLAHEFLKADAHASMSSPKRFLWDTTSSSLPWCKVMREAHEEGINTQALYGLASEFNSKGFLLNKDEFGEVVGVANALRNPRRSREYGDTVPADSSDYSRLGVMSFAMAELLLQAISQMNSVAFREDLGSPTSRRKLKHVVITCPTAMVQSEQVALRSSMLDAIESLKVKYPGKFWADGLEIIPDPIEHQRQLQLPDGDIPRAHWNFDEATCTQLAYVYSQVAHRLQGDANEFCRLFGAKRQGDEHTVRIASVDIGGGTTDMMICEYHVSDGQAIQPKPLFWEGFNVAGDDLLKAVIEQYIIPQFREALIEAGGTNVTGTLNYLFGQVGQQTNHHRMMKQQFTHQVLAPVAMQMLSHVSENEGFTAIVVRDTLADHPPKDQVVAYYNSIIRQECRIQEFDVLDLDLDCDPRAVNKAAKVLEGVLEELSSVIAQYECDTLLLTGRPSKLDVVHDLIMNSVPISPDGVIRLGGYRIGSWYPFTDRLAMIRDPKTTVAVGGIIALLAHLDRLPAFRLDTTQMQLVHSTVRYVGVMETNGDRVLDDALALTPANDAGVVSFNGNSIIVGFRQVPLEDWWGTALYRITWKNDDSAREFAQRGGQLPLNIHVKRSELDGDLFEEPFVEAVDQAGNAFAPSQFIDFHLQSLKSEDDSNYWKDSGNFNLMLTD